MQKSGMSDLALRESLQLVWGRRFSCDVATGMIPLGDLFLGNRRLAWYLVCLGVRSLEFHEDYRGIFYGCNRSLCLPHFVVLLCFTVVYNEIVLRSTL